MYVNNAKYYIISDKLNWVEGHSQIIGQDYNRMHQHIQNQGFITHIGGNEIPSNVVIDEMINFLQTQNESELLGEDYHYDITKTLLEAADIMNNSLMTIRENLFEEVRKEKFPHLPSRQKCTWVIPEERETLKFRMDQFRNPQSKIYELNLTGKIHRSDSRALELASLAPEIIRNAAYMYWLGNQGDNTPHDDVIFEGLLEVVKIIDDNSVRQGNK